MIAIRKTAALVALAAAAALAPSAGAAMPTDPQASAQEPLKIMRVGEARDRIARPLEDVPVLVLDTGIDRQHPDLESRRFSLSSAPAPIIHPDPNADRLPPLSGPDGYDLIGTLNPGFNILHPDGDPDDPVGGTGHGTAVAGLLGAENDNGQGGAGIAPNAKFVALRTCWDGTECYQYVQAYAINWAVQYAGVRVVNIGWQAGQLEEGLEQAIRSHPETLFVATPSGDGAPYDADPTNPEPCNLNAPNVLCVSTSSPDDGLDCGAYGEDSVDVAVPTRNNITPINNGRFQITDCSTGWAAPEAAGVATTLFGIDPTASARTVKQAIVDGARKVPAWRGKSVSEGIVDAEAAVDLFQERQGIPAAPRPAKTQPQQQSAPSATPTAQQQPATPAPAPHRPATPPRASRCPSRATSCAARRPSWARCLRAPRCTLAWRSRAAAA